MARECHFFPGRVLTLLCSGLGRHVFTVAVSHSYNVVWACLFTHHVVVNHTSPQACRVPMQTRACVGILIARVLRLSVMLQSCLCIPAMSQQYTGRSVHACLHM